MSNDNAFVALLILSVGLGGCSSDDVDSQDSEDNPTSETSGTGDATTGLPATSTDTTSTSTSGSSSSTDTTSGSTSSNTDGTDGSSGEGTTDGGSSSGGGTTGGVTDTPPSIGVLSPGTDLLGNSGLIYDGYDETLELWYVDVDLTALAYDQEDGLLSEDVVWTTDQEGIQDAGLGSGAMVTVRFYSDDCFGVTHSVTATVTDTDGNASFAIRNIRVFELC